MLIPNILDQAVQSYSGTTEGKAQVTQVAGVLMLHQIDNSTVETFTNKKGDQQYRFTIPAGTTIFGVRRPTSAATKATSFSEPNDKKFGILVVNVPPYKSDDGNEYSQTRFVGIGNTPEEVAADVVDQYANYLRRTSTTVATTQDAE